MKKPKKTKKWRNYFWAGLLIFTVIYFQYLDIREAFFGKQPQFAQLRDTTYLQQMFQQQAESKANVIVPCGWYSNDGLLTPMIAGVCDGAYQSCVAIKDISVFIAKYSSDGEYRKEINNDLDVLWANKSDVLSLTGKQIKDLGVELSGEQGSAKAKYAYGKVLFDAMTLVVGTGEINAVSKVIKNAKILKALKTLPFTKLANIAKACPPCAAIYKASPTLRNDLLTTNIATTTKLMEADFVKSGKTWEVFIKEYEAHHIIPVNLLDESIELQFYYNHGGTIRFNSMENGMMLKKVCKEEGLHANHPQYSKIILKKIEVQFTRIDEYKVPDIEKVRLMDKELKKIIEETRELIIEKSVKNNVKINNIFQ